MFKQLKQTILLFSSAALALFAAVPASATTITIDTADFAETCMVSSVSIYTFSIEVAGPLAPGGVYNNPTLVGVDYSVRGSLVSGTPSGFPGFNLVRTIGGAEFYSQGSSLSFAILPTANLSDGLQLNELAGAGVVFELNAREVDTGRYHPPILQLLVNGT